MGEEEGKDYYRKSGVGCDRNGRYDVIDSCAKSRTTLYRRQHNVDLMFPPKNEDLTKEIIAEI